MNTKTRKIKGNGVRTIPIFCLSSEQIADYFNSVYRELKIDLNPLGKSIIIDTHELDVEDAIKYFNSDCDIYCLGMPNETPENVKRKIRENDTEDDWTYHTGDIILDMACNQIVEHSKELQEQCKKYNIKFFDTSGNRKEKIKEIVKQIEENTINR